MTTGRFNGVAILPDREIVPFSDKDKFHTLDGMKVRDIVVNATVTSKEDAEKLINFLTIAKEALNGS
jgi:hypothetical protein